MRPCWHMRPMLAQVAVLAHARLSTCARGCPCAPCLRARLRGLPTRAVLGLCLAAPAGTSSATPRASSQVPQPALRGARRDGRGTFVPRAARRASGAEPRRGCVGDHGDARALPRPRVPRGSRRRGRAAFTALGTGHGHGRCAPSRLHPAHSRWTGHDDGGWLDRQERLGTARPGITFERGRVPSELRCGE